MNKIEFIKIECRNFLSYGNTWETLDIKSGMNIIQGKNIDTDKSNGSGKTSILETMPFALFGKTIKDIKKADIVNWINGKNCEVKLTTMINDVEYIFHRGIRPNIYSVYKDGVEIPKLSDVRIFQSEIESDIIGMDFKTFQHLIHYNPNSISLLKSKKDEKRKFLTSLFDLSVYSRLLKITNDKLRSKRGYLTKIESSIDSNTTLISSYQRDLETSQIIDIKSKKLEHNKLQMIYDAQKDKEIEYDEVAHDKNTSDIRKANKHLVSLKQDVITLQTKINLTKESILKIGDIDEMRTDVKVKQVELDKLKCDDSPDLTQDLEVLVINLKDSKEKLLNEQTILNNLKIEETKLVTLKDGLVKERIKLLHPHSRLDDSVLVCPTCKQDVDHDRITLWTESEVAILDKKIDLFNDGLIISKENIDFSNQRLDDIRTSIKEDKVLYDDIKQKIDLYNKRLHKIELLESVIKGLPSPDDKQKELDGYNNEIDDLNKSIKKLEWSIDIQEQEISSLEEFESVHKKYLFTKIEHEKKMNTMKTQLNSSDTSLKSFEKLNKSIQESDDIKKKDIQTLTDENIILEKGVISSNKLIDHLDYLKVTLKDENIKQYSISSILPYLNKKVNEYLNESQLPYTVNVDGWLDVHIKGLGIESVSYGSLSGGETKCIDMALIFACNDLVEIQANTILNIGIMDEVLDTSLDEDGVLSLIDIISTRQKHNNSAVFVITHRRELLKDVDFDDVINIVNENGFSRIQKEK